MMDSVLTLIFCGFEKEPPAAVPEPGCSTQEPAPQFVPAIVAATPLIEKHMRLAALLAIISPRTLPLVNTV